MRPDNSSHSDVDALILSGANSIEEILPTLLVQGSASLIFKKLGNARIRFTFKPVSEEQHELRGEIVHYGTCFHEELKEIFQRMMAEFYNRNRS